MLLTRRAVPRAGALLATNLTPATRRGFGQEERGVKSFEPDPAAGGGV